MSTIKQQSTKPTRKLNGKPEGPAKQQGDNFDEVHLQRQDEFFRAMQKALIEHNFSDETLALIDAKCGFTEGYHLVLFDGGLLDIALQYQDWLDEQMLQHLAKEEHDKASEDKQAKKPSIRATIAKALNLRIIELQPKECAIKMSAFFMLPCYTASGLSAAAKSCDKIWRYAGDKSVDYNYYTKRGLLLGVYLSGQTYYYADRSQEFNDTRGFINSSLDNVVKIASGLKNKIPSGFKMPEMADIPIFRMFS